MWIIGLANIIPGVSGGTMAVSMGIYDKVIHCISHFFSELKKNIPISQEFREDVRIMCNLSTGIEERATEKTSEKFILNMYKKGYTLDQIADVAETGVDEVEAIIKKREPAMA